MICQSTLKREYTRRPDGLFMKIVQWDMGNGKLRTEVIIRSADGQLIRVETKRGPRS
jgi:hypothetical protein